jgi:tRNA uridine 5-carboxymethylaminomethyl modification enzyme
MFTSRAEFRLQLREDNADMRLTEVGRELGLVDDIRWDAFNRKRDAVSRETDRLKSTWVRPATLPAADAERLLGKAVEREHNLGDLLRRPGVDYDQVCEMGLIAAARQEVLRAEAGKTPSTEGGVSRETSQPVDRASMRASLGEALADAVIEQVEISIKYAGYIDKQNDEVERAAYYENLKLPADLDYMQVSALSIEARQKLTTHKPETLGQASRISGITPAAVSLLLIHLKKGRAKGFASAGAADADLTAAP